MFRSVSVIKKISINRNILFFLPLLRRFLFINTEIYWTRIPEKFFLPNIENYLDYLNSDEITTFNRYKVDSKKIEFLLGRILVKKTISKKLNIHPSKIEFKKNVYGKLFLEACYSSKEQIFFNLSHSNELIVCAISTTEVGIDVEKISIKDLTIMEHVFVKNEIEYILAEENIDIKQDRFYEIWTLKEAYLKAIGKGFYENPLNVQVIKGNNISPEKNYDFFTFNPCKNYKISVAVRQEVSSHLYKITELFIDKLIK